MKATHVMALALALTLVGMPTFVLSADLSPLQGSALMTSTPAQSTDSFRALSKVTGVDTAAPAPLTDQELTQVEGAFHLETARAFFAMAFLYALAGNFHQAINSAIAGTLIGFMFDHSPDH